MYNNLLSACLSDECPANTFFFLSFLFYQKLSFHWLQIEMIYKIIAHMAANDRALIAEGSCGSPRSLKVFLGECNVDELFA